MKIHGSIGCALLLGSCLAACGTSFEDACNQICEAQAECATDATNESLDECRADCARRQSEADRQLDNGQITQACYDAARDNFDCISGGACDELNTEQPPAECAAFAEAVVRECPQ